MPLPAPPLPSGLTATASGTGSIALSWTALSGAAYYGVYQYFPATSELPAYWGKVAEDVPGATYTVSGLDCGMTYHYGVSAYGDGVTYTESVEQRRVLGAGRGHHRCLRRPGQLTPGVRRDRSE